MNSFYSQDEMKHLGLKSYGENVQISRKCSIYNPSNIEIGNNVRIDDFCILSAGDNPFIIKDNIHISAGVYIYGAGGFIMESYTNISPGTKIFTITDDFSGEYMVGANIDRNCRRIIEHQIHIHKYVVIGSNSVVLPTAILEEGVAIGANSLVKSKCNSWTIYGGTPLSYIKKRSNILIDKCI